MAGKKPSVGATGRTVAENVARLRTGPSGQNLSYAELSRQLSALGVPIPELGLRNLERGKRKVDVDELIALAIVLRVAPVTLLLPHVDSGEEHVSATGMEDPTARQLWHWLTGGGVPGGEEINLDDLLRARPQWTFQEGAPEAEYVIKGILEQARAMQRSPRGDD